MAKEHYSPLTEALEECETAMVKVALLGAWDEEGQKYESPSFSAEEEEMLHRRAKEMRPRMDKLIDREYHLRMFRGDTFASAWKVIKVAGMIILFANLALTLAVAVNETVRAKVIEYLTVYTDQCVEIRYKETGNAVEVPEGWTEDYYPTYIPEGYECGNVSSGSGQSLVEYQESSGHSFSFYVSHIESYVFANSEEAQLSVFPIDSTAEAMLISDELETTIVWSVGDKALIVKGTCSHDELKKIAKSVMMISE